MQLTESERRLFLDLLDEEHSRDRRTHSIGRTTDEVYRDQVRVYATLRQKLVQYTPVPDSEG